VEQTEEKNPIGSQGYNARRVGNFVFLIIVGVSALATNRGMEFAAGKVVLTATPTPVPSATPTPTPDSALESQPAVGSGTDDNSLESDINSTQILDEDFSDLE